MNEELTAELSVAAAERMRAQLDASFARYVAALREAPVDYQEDMHVNMCVRIAGFLEQLVHLAVGHYVTHSQGDLAAKAFALSWWKRSPNLTPQAFVGVIERFGEDWATDVTTFLDQEERRDNLGRLMKVRNDTAHGANYAGSRPNVTTYKVLADDVYQWISERLLVTPNH